MVEFAYVGGTDEKYEIPNIFEKVWFNDDSGKRNQYREL